jgi:hypothetical protein
LDRQATDPGVAPIAWARASRLRERSTADRFEIELVTDLGPVVAAFIYVPATLLGFLGVHDLTSFIWLALLGPSATTIFFASTSLFQRVVRVITTADSLSVELNGARTTLSLSEIQDVVVYTYPKASRAHGLDIVRKDGSRIEVRAWNPSEAEALLARDRLRFLVEDARRRNPHRG